MKHKQFIMIMDLKNTGKCPTHMDEHFVWIVETFSLIKSSNHLVTLNDIDQALSYICENTLKHF